MGWLKHAGVSPGSINPTTKDHSFQSLEGVTVAQGTINIVIKTSRRYLVISCTILHTDTIIPPLVSFGDLPDFQLHKSGKMKFTSCGSELDWETDPATRLLFTSIAVGETSNKALLSTEVQSLIHELHKDANHASSARIMKLIESIPNSVLKRSDVAELISNCEVCAKEKDNSHRGFQDIENVVSTPDMAGCDIVSFNPPSDGYVGVLIVRAKMSKHTAGRLLKSHSAEEIRKHLVDIFGDGFPVPMVFRVDGERGFTIDVAQTLQEFGVQDFQVTPPRTHTAAGLAENAIKLFIQSLRMVMADNNADRSQWSKFVPQAIRRMNNYPDKHGLSSMEKVFGHTPLAAAIKRIERALQNELYVRFPPGSEVLFTPTNRKEVRGFNKLDTPWLPAVVVDAPQAHVRRVLLENGQIVKCLLRNIKKRPIATPASPASDQNNSAESDNLTQVESNSQVSENNNSAESDENQQGEQVPESPDTEPTSESLLHQTILFEHSKKNFLADVIEEARVNITVHLRGLADKNHELMWNVSNQLRGTQRFVFSDRKPQLQRFERAEACTFKIRKEHVLRTVRLSGGRLCPIPAEKLSQPTTLPADLFVLIASDTTHQKLSFSKLTGNDRTEAINAFNMEMKKFEEYDVFDPVQAKSVPRGATVVRPVVVFTSKMRPDGTRTAKCRVTANGSTVLQPETSTSNADMSEIRLLFSIASASPEYAGRYSTADAEQGYLQVPIRSGDDIYMVPPDMHPHKSDGF